MELRVVNDVVKNYSANNNGIFFDFNKLSSDIVDNVLKFIENYNRISKEKINYEKNRTKMVNTKNTVYKDTMQKLSEEIEQSKLHTDIDIDNDNTEEDPEDFSIKKQESYKEEAVVDEDDVDYKDLFGESEDEDMV